MALDNKSSIELLTQLLGQKGAFAVVENMLRGSYQSEHIHHSRSCVDSGPARLTASARLGGDSRTLGQRTKPRDGEDRGGLKWIQPCSLLSSHFALKEVKS